MCLSCCSGLVITMVVSLLFILLLRYTAGVLLWLIIFGVITVVGYGEYVPCKVTHIASGNCILNTHVVDVATFVTSNILTDRAVDRSVVMENCSRFRFVLPCCIFSRLSYFLSVSLCLSGIWHCYWEYRALTGKPGTNVTISDIGFHTDFSIYLQLSQTWLIFSMLSSTTIPLHHT